MFVWVWLKELWTGLDACFSLVAGGRWVCFPLSISSLYCRVLVDSQEPQAFLGSRVTE